MTREEAAELLEPCKDIVGMSEYERMAVQMGVEALRQPERPKGRWECGCQNGANGYWCSNCHAGFTGDNAEWIAKEHDFCPKCGSDNRGEEE